MNLGEGLRQAFEVLAGNKLRSALTMLGIIFGVGCLIAISIVGGAFRGSINGELGRFGSTLVWVQVNGRAYARGERATYLSEDDIRFFTSSLPGIEYSGTVLSAQQNVSYRGESRSTQVYGVAPGHFVIFANPIAQGRAFTAEDVRERAKVCVVRPDLAYALFQDENPLGASLRVGDEVYTVIGVTQALENPLLGDGSSNDTLFIPSELMSRRIFGAGPPRYYVYFFRFRTTDDVNVATQRIGAYLGNRYGDLRGVPRFRVDKSDQYIVLVDRILNVVNLLVTVIASISLLVGGLGIMNIMLVTVAERTREIGVRMAIGARRRDILAQFLIEAVAICLIGGAVGAGFGAALASVACSLLHWSFSIAPRTIALAVIVSSAIGLLFGTYPAHRASRLTPVEALRAEA